jgi:hypothetical protein
VTRPWSTENPGGGDTAALRGQAVRWEQLAYQVHELRTRAVSVLAEVGPDVWTGQAADAWRTEVDQLATELASFAQQLMDRANTMFVYVGRVEQIAEDAHVWRLRRYEPEYRARALRRLEELAEERRGADTRACAELDPVCVGTWRSVATGLQAIGGWTTWQVGPEDIARQLTAWADGFHDRPLSEQEATELAALLHAWGGDEQAMNAFFSALGGAGTLSLLVAICDSEHLTEGEALELATLVRSGLAVGSTTWDVTTAEPFAAGLLDPLADATRDGADRLRDLWALSFLLDDALVHPFGADLALALADRVDLIERTRPEEAIWLTPPHPATTGLVSTGLLLGYVHGQGDPSDPHAGLRYDIPGLVFEHLGAHPDTALGWLSSTAPDVDGDGTVGDGRVAHWFGERDWTVSGDDFAGPLTLWRGAMNATGGPADPEAYDPAVWHRVADTMHAIAAAALSNPMFLPENVSDLAGTQLAGVLSAQLTTLLEVPLREAPDGGVTLTHLPGADDPRWVAGLTRDQLAALLGIATSTPTGLELMTRTITTVQDALLGAATRPGCYTPDEALHVIATLQTMLDAAPAGAAAGARARADAAAQGVLDVVGLALSVIKLPGIDEAVADLAERASELVPEVVTSTVAGQALGAVPGILTGQEGPWAATYPDSGSRAAAEVDKADLTDAIAAWAERLQAPEAQNPANGGSYREYAKTVVSDYDDLFEAFENYAMQRSDDDE